MSLSNSSCLENGLNIGIHPFWCGLISSRIVYIMNRVQYLIGMLYIDWTFSGDFIRLMFDLLHKPFYLPLRDWVPFPMRDIVNPAPRMWMRQAGK